jgi:acetyl esterase/lipase
MLRKIFLVAIFSIAALSIAARDFIEDKNVPYRQGAERCVMDIYHPTTAGGQLPVIIWFHGGGLTGGNKSVPKQLKTGDYVVVAPEYRLIPNVEIEDCIDDAALATTWVINNIAKLGGDTTKIFVAGHSAGGYLTSMIGLDKSWLQKYGKDADSLAGLIPFSGQVITHFAQRQRNGISELTPTIDRLAPLFHVRKDAPPYVIITGDRELELYGRYEENAYMWRMLKLVGHPYVYIYELDGYNHGQMSAPAHHILKNHIKAILDSRKQ